MFEQLRLSNSTLAMANATASLVVPKFLLPDSDNIHHITSISSSTTSDLLSLSENLTALHSTLGLCVSALTYLCYKLVTSIRQRSRSVHDTIPTISSSLLPRSILNFSFAVSAVNILEYGYTKFKGQAFRIMRGDSDIVVLPSDLLEELSRLPATIASPHGALEKDLLGTYTGLDIILDSRIHHSIVQRKLSPRLQQLTPCLEEELKLAMDAYMPSCNTTEWTTFQPYQIFAKISARLSSRALVGEKFCRDESWLDVAVNYTENLFRTIVLLRLFPSWFHAFIYRLLPSYWAGQKHITASRNLLSKPITELLEKNDSGEWTPQDTPSDSTVLHWLADSAKKGDRNPNTLAHVEVLLALASVHTTLLRMVNVLYDLTANPSYIPSLREEISEHGTSYSHLHKLDSILRESQRMSPPTTLGLKRVFKFPHTFSSGLHIPEGTYVCMPTYAIENDPENTPHPETFDGMRSYRARQAAASSSSTIKGKEDEFSFSAIDAKTLNFGYGKSACPGRHFASLMLKMFFVKLLGEYEFRFREGCGRPRNYTVHEFLFCWPWERMQIRRRVDAACPF